MTPKEELLYRIFQRSRSPHKEEKPAAQPATREETREEFERRIMNTPEAWTECGRMPSFGGFA